jgi:hypothetical protein
MESAAFQQHCKQWFGNLGEFQEAMLQGILRGLQTEVQGDSHRPFEESLVRVHANVSEFLGHLKPFEDAIHSQLRQTQLEQTFAKNAVVGDQARNASITSLISGLTGLEGLQSRVSSLPSEHPCQSQIRMVQQVFQTLVMLASKFCEDYEKVTHSSSEMIIAMGKILTLHFRRSLVNTFVTSMDIALQQVLHRDLPKQLVQVQKTQTQIAQLQKNLYTKALSTFEVDAQHFQELLRMLATLPHDSQRLAAISHRLTELSLFVNTWMRSMSSSATRIDITVFPILEDVHRGLTLVLQDIASWVETFVVKQRASSSPSSSDSAPPERKVPCPMKPHITSLLRYVDTMHKEQSSASSELENQLKHLAALQSSLSTKIKQHQKEQKQTFEQCTRGSTLPVRWIRNQSMVDPQLAQKLLQLDSTLEGSKLKRDMARQRFLDHQLQHTSLTQNKQTLKHVSQFLRLWEQRDYRWRQMIRREWLLLASWRNLRLAYYTHLCDMQHAWSAVAKMELTTLVTSNSLIARDMLLQVQEFQHRQWLLLVEKQKAIFRHLAMLSLMFQRIVRQISTLCMDDSRYLCEQFQHMQHILSQLETYWTVRYQKDMIRAFRKNATFLFALVTLLLRENRDMSSTLHKFTRAKTQISQLLQDQQSHIQKFSCSKLDTDKVFRDGLRKVFQGFGAEGAAPP